MPRTHASPSLPPVYLLLAESRNAAADRALVEALPASAAMERVNALEILLQRNRTSGLAYLVARFPHFDGALKNQLSAQCERLSAGLRAAIDGPDLETRLAAIDLIRRSRSGRLAYLLSGALSRPCAKTREAAARGLQDLVEVYFEVRESAERGATQPAAAGLRGELASAIRQALACWEAHFRTEVVTAAMWLSDKLEDAILARIDGPRSRLGRAFDVLLGPVPDPRTAGYLLRALRSPVLRTKAARRIGDCRDDEAMLALLDELWVAGDPEMGKLLSWVRRLAWLEAGIEPALSLTPPRAEALTALVGAIGLPNGLKTSLLKQLALAGRAVLARGALWALIGNASEESTAALRLLARQGDEAIAQPAERELRRRSPTESGAVTVVETECAKGHDVEPETFEGYWAGLDALSPERQTEIGQRLRYALPAFDQLLSEKLGAGDPAERARALQVARRLGAAPAVDKALYALAHDTEPTVRSAAITALSDLDNPTARRILRNALHDPDVRVQANAIESLDALEAGPFVPDIRGKLGSPDNRVRANAVKSLLKLELREAGESLLAMLSAASRADRLSALWVIECLELHSLTDRLVTLARSDPDPQVRHRAAELARRIGALRAEGDRPEPAEVVGG